MDKICALLVPGRIPYACLSNFYGLLDFDMSINFPLLHTDFKNNSIYWKVDVLTEEKDKSCTTRKKKILLMGAEGHKFWDVTFFFQDSNVIFYILIWYTRLNGLYILLSKA